ncbi:MAG: homoserine dehydrogenase [Bacilli bacterium]|jgi:homoserine dehydrogenase|nr:homoserine dehydrogenase [Bacilli bacterium]
MKIAILGLGTIGTGVYNQIINNKEKIELEINDVIDIKYGLVTNVTGMLQKRFTETTLTTDIVEILDDKEIDCIIDAFSNVKFSYPAIKKAIKNKIHIVSANKNLIALYGVELMRYAKENNVDFYFEASVAGGVPIIRSITKGLASDYIYDIKGILNGTTNYILSKMSYDGIDFKSACKNAKDLGYTELHIADDVNGIDTARKIAILSMLCYRVDVKLTDVNYKGIEDVSLKDIEIAHNLGYEIKLIGHSHYENNQLLINVHPCFVATNHPLDTVSYEMNSVYVSGRSIGEIMLYGSGTGGNANATAIVADLLEVASNMKYQCNSRDIIIPSNQKEITYGNNIERYIFIGDERMIQQVLNTIPVIKYTKDYVIGELSSQQAYELVLENKWKIYPIIEASNND